MSDNFIRDGVVLDLSNVTRHSLRFMLSDTSPPPNSTAQSTTDAFGAVTTFYHWCIESADALIDNKSKQVQSYLVTYVFPVEEEASFTEKWKMGSTMTREEAITYAIRGLPA